MTAWKLLDPDGRDDAVRLVHRHLARFVHRKECIKRNTFMFWLDISVGGHTDSICRTSSLGGALLYRSPPVLARSRIHLAHNR